MFTEEFDCCPVTTCSSLIIYGVSRIEAGTGWDIITFYYFDALLQLSLHWDLVSIGINGSAIFKEDMCLSHKSLHDLWCADLLVTSCDITAVVEVVCNWKNQIRVWAATCLLVICWQSFALTQFRHAACWKRPAVTKMTWRAHCKRSYIWQYTIFTA